MSDDACVRSTEFGNLSHVRMIIHSYTRSESLAAMYTYMMGEASKEHILGAQWLIGRELDSRSRG